MHVHALKDKILNKWIEYSGGSRPQTNMLRFSDDVYGQRLEIRYVFDWDTHEVVHLFFTLDPGDIDSLFNKLVKDGAACLKKESKDDDILFEWKISEGRIMFRANAHGYAGSEGYIRYIIDEYRDLILDESE